MVSVSWWISIDKGILITAEGVHPSEKLINAKDRAEAAEYGQWYAELFEEVEVRQVVRVRRAARSGLTRRLNPPPADGGQKTIPPGTAVRLPDLLPRAAKLVVGA